MTRVDCDDCSMNFQTKKLYIQHLKSKKCTKSKHASPGQAAPAAKKPRLEGQAQTQSAMNESLLKVGLPQQSNSSQYSQKQMEVLQSQITQLSQKQKELLQAQITQKQRQVLQAIPYNQLSEKQKEILKRLSGKSSPSPTPPLTPTTASSSKQSAAAASPTFVKIRPTAAQTAAAASQAKENQVEQNIKKGRRKNVYNKIPELKNGQIVKIQNPSVTHKASEPVSEEPIIKDFVFSDEPIAADDIEIAGEAVSMVAPTEFVTTDELDDAVKSIARNPLELPTEVDESAPAASKATDNIGTTLKIKSIANVFQDISNIVSPTATPKETCSYCKKIFSKASLQQHIESKHRTKCGHCDLRFLEEEMAAHIKEHMAPCDVCKTNMIKEDIEYHIDSLHKQACKFCQSKILKSELEAHIRNIHEPEGCDECDSRFETKALLKEHVDKMHLVEVCEECADRFRTEEEMEKHAVEVHPKEYCEEDECDAVFSTVALLDEHKEKAHPNPNKFVSFNGGMFMMMMQVDEEEEEEEEKEESDEDEDSNNRIKELEEAERATTYEFFKQLIIDTADNVVKTAMTGKILFALRFNDDEVDEDENQQDTSTDVESEADIDSDDEVLPPDSPSNKNYEFADDRTGKPNYDEESLKRLSSDPLDFVDTNDSIMHE